MSSVINFFNNLFSLPKKQTTQQKQAGGQSQQVGQRKQAQQVGQRKQAQQVGQRMQLTQWKQLQQRGGSCGCGM